MRIHCSYENNEFIDAYLTGNSDGVVIETFSPSQTKMGEISSIVVDSQGIDDLVSTLQTLKEKLK